ncbi:MAG: SCO family protein [Acidobacteriota bacterium]
MTRIGRWCGLAALAVVGAAGVRADRPRDPVGAPAQAAVSPASERASIYDLDLPLVDAEGRHLVLADLRGRTLVAAMMYTSCQSVCPRVTEDMKGIERQLRGLTRQDVTFVLFSLDAGRDTPGMLGAFAAEHELDATRWRLFAATDDGVRDLSAVLGVKYKQEADGDIAHSAMIVVVDPQGVIRHRQVGLTESPAELIAAISRARS